MRRRPGRPRDTGRDRLLRPKDLGVNSGRVGAPCFQARAEAAEEGRRSTQIEISAAIHAKLIEQGRVKMAG